MRLRSLFLLFVLLFHCNVNGLVILQYHHVSDKTPEATSISPHDFALQLAYLEESGFKVVSILALKKLLQAGKSPPDGAVVITFDDGYMSVFKNAYPALKERKWPFTVFVNTQPHDQNKPQFMSWDQLREIAKNGATIANHTDSHLHLLRKREGESDKQWNQRRAKEIEFAEKRIKKEIGKSHRLFAYPYGEHDRAIRKYLKEKGYLAFGQQSGPVPSPSSPQYDGQLIPRFPFGGKFVGLSDFATKVTSLPFPALSVSVNKINGAPLYEAELPMGVNRPIMRISTPTMQYLDGLNCFASGQGKIKSERKGNTLVVQANRSLPVGRSRYNCTARAGNGRFFWYSHMYIKRRADGSWYPEY